MQSPNLQSDICMWLWTPGYGTSPKLMKCAQGGTGLLNSQGLPLLRASETFIMGGHAQVQWHQCTMGDWKMPGLPRHGLWLYQVKSLRPGPKRGCLTLDALGLDLIFQQASCHRHFDDGHGFPIIFAIHFRTFARPLPTEQVPDTGIHIYACIS